MESVMSVFPVSDQASKRSLQAFLRHAGLVARANAMLRRRWREAPLNSLNELADVVRAGLLA
jgi:hypothetical protein